MDERIHRIAALANTLAYDEKATKEYIDGAPHIKHNELRKLYGKLMTQVFDNATSYTKIPKVLDLGLAKGPRPFHFLNSALKWSQLISPRASWTRSKLSAVGSAKC